MNHQQKNAISPEHEYLGISKSFAYGLQHVLTMYGGIVAPPLIIGTAAGLSAAQVGMLIAAALFVGGLATLIQTIGTKYLGAKLPLVQGVSLLVWQPWLPLLPQVVVACCLRRGYCSLSNWTMPCTLLFKNYSFFPTCCDRMRHHDYWAIAITRCDSLDDGWQQ
jgi:hypothetical protein